MRALRPSSSPKGSIYPATPPPAPRPPCPRVPPATRSTEKPFGAITVYCLGQFDRGEVAIPARASMTIGELTSRLRETGYLDPTLALDAWMIIHVRVGTVLGSERTLVEARVKYGDFLYWRIDGRRCPANPLRQLRKPPLAPPRSEGRLTPSRS